MAKTHPSSWLPTRWWQRQPPLRRHLLGLNLALLVWFVLLYGGLWGEGAVLTKGPTSYHGWAQASCYALTDQFAERGLDPTRFYTHGLAVAELFPADQVPDTAMTGRTAFQFPMHVYLPAIPLAALGATDGETHYGLLRGYALLWGWLGLNGLFLALWWLGAPKVGAWLGVAFATAGPVYAFYQANMLPTGPSLGMLFLGWGLAVRYAQTRHRGLGIGAYVLLLLMALGRFPYAMHLGGLMLLGLWADPPRRLWYLLGGVLAVAALAAEYLYIQYLVERYYTVFLSSAQPFQDLEDVGRILKQMASRWREDYFSLGQWAFMALVLVLGLATWRLGLGAKVRQLVGGYLAVIWVGGLLYFYLMGRQFGDHDYYFLDALYPQVVATMGLVLLSPRALGGWRSWALAAVAVWMLVGTVDRHLYRYTMPRWPGSLEEKLELQLHDYQGAAAWLRAEGFGEPQTPLLVAAHTPCNALQLIDRPGYVTMTTMPQGLDVGLRFKWDFVVVPNRYVDEVLANYPAWPQRLQQVATNGRLTVWVRRQPAHEGATTPPGEPQPGG